MPKRTAKQTMGSLAAISTYIAIFKPDVYYSGGIPIQRLLLEGHSFCRSDRRVAEEKMVKEEKIAQAKKLRQADKLEQSQAVLLELLESHPDDPLVLFEVGGSYDVLGEERQAIPYYQQAIEAGLEGADLQECFVCLGSSYRIIGEFEKAIDILQTAEKRFPDDNSARVFLALAYYSDGREDDAVSILIDVLLKTTQDQGILVYADALDYYKDNLDEVWDEE